MLVLPRLRSPQCTVLCFVASVASTLVAAPIDAQDSALKPGAVQAAPTGMPDRHVATPPTPEASQGEVELETTTGTWVRGSVVEFVPGDHVTIRLPSGEERRYPWAIVRVYRSILPPAETAPATPTPTPTPRPPGDRVEVSDDRRDDERSMIESFDPQGQRLPESAPTVVVEVEGATPGLRLQILSGYSIVGRVVTQTNLYGIPGTTSRTEFRPTFATVCRAPCRLRLGVGMRYRVYVATNEETNTGLPSVSTRMRITDDVTSLTLVYRNRSRFRRRAWWAVGVMPVLGAVLAGMAKVIPPGHFGGAEYGRNEGVFWMGVGLMCTPAMSFVVPMLVRDRSRVRVHRRGI